MSRLDPDKPTVLRYEREHDLIRLTITNMSNHELREVILGLWCRLDEDDRADHIIGMTHYFKDPEAWLSVVAAALKKNPGDGGIVDLAALARRGEKVRP
jgi:glycine cleavage system regulatory protein